MGYYSCRFLILGKCRAKRLCKNPDGCCVFCPHLPKCLEKQSVCQYMHTVIPFGHVHICDQFHQEHCMGGNYCNFPAGQAQKCCKDCPLLFNCPDEDGVCMNLIPRKK